MSLQAGDQTNGSKAAVLPNGAYEVCAKHSCFRMQNPNDRWHISSSPTDLLDELGASILKGILQLDGTCNGDSIVDDLR